MGTSPFDKSRVGSADRSLQTILRRSHHAKDPLLPTLADRTDDAIFVVDADRNVVLFNKSAEAITGFDRSEVVGRHCLTGFRCSRCLEACQLFDRGSVEDVELDLFRKDGSTVRVRKTASVVRDREGKPIGAVEVFHPSDPDAPTPMSPGPNPWQAFDGMMGALGRAALVLNEDFRIIRASESLAKLVKRPHHDLIGQPADSLLDLCSPGSLFRAALEAGERREGWRATVPGLDGSPIRLSVTGAPLDEAGPCEGGSGETPRFLLVVRPDTDDLSAAESVADDPAIFEGMVAKSKTMRRVFQLIEHLRDSDATVLITGESGTGKELVARAIHARSIRSTRPFVAVNCGALPADLLETELFGHVRGAFTGAVRDKPGRVEVAANGTLFLDEIGDLPLPLQVKLLRLLQERTFERVGENHSRPFQARVVAATHQDLARAVANKSFRDDLYYRLSVVPITLPNLRERPEDLEMLVLHLLEKIGRRRSRSLRLSPPVMRELLSRDWPGNIRQLENALEYATAVCAGQTIHVEDLPDEPKRAEVNPASALAPAVPDPRPSVPPGPLGAYPTAEALMEALRKSRFRRSEAAKALGVSRTTLWRRMKELGLA